MNCPYCEAPSKHENGEGVFVCGARIWANGRMTKRGDACTHIAALQAVLNKLATQTDATLRTLVDARVRELMGK